MIGRTLNGGKAFLRRSTDRQEASLTTQMNWAMKKAAEMGVKLRASLAELQHMQENRLSKFNDVYLDDAKSGADMTRLGLTSLLSDAISDQSISHIFVYLPDRLARPEEPLVAAAMQNRLLSAGITIVFCDRILPPRQRGENHFAQDMLSLYHFTEAGDYLNRLAQRVIEGQIVCAEAGGWTGTLWFCPCPGRHGWEGDSRAIRWHENSKTRMPDKN
jgi:DNA invertase Pin-like site-specific DNA recombinase